jgi:hypothetical protein
MLLGHRGDVPVVRGDRPVAHAGDTAAGARGGAATFVSCCPKPKTLNPKPYEATNLWPMLETQPRGLEAGPPLSSVVALNPKP